MVHLGKSAAVGKYQMVYPEVFASKAGLDPAKDKFTPGNQDRMALYGYIMGQGGVTEAEINASEISDQTIDKLAPVFASFPNLFGPGDKGKAPGDGVSYYANQGAKYKADIKAQFRKERGGGSQPQQSVQPQTPKIGGQTYTVAGVTYDVSTGLPISGHETQASRQVTPDNSEKASIQNQSNSDTSSAPAQVTASPSVQSQMSSGISGISQNLPYQQVGGQQVVMVQSSGGQQLGGVVGGQQGSMIMMGSQQVLNSYHKSQILGFLYKQG